MVIKQELAIKCSTHFYSMQDPKYNNSFYAKPEAIGHVISKLSIELT